MKDRARGVRSIKMKISLVLAALVIAGFTVLTALVFSPMQRKAEADAEESLINIAENAHFIVAQAIDFPTAFLRSNAADIALYAGRGIVDREGFVGHIYSQVSQFPYISSFWFIFNHDAYDNDGARYAGTDYGDDIDGTSFAGIIYGSSGQEHWQNIALAEYDIYNDPVYLEALDMGRMYLKAPYTEVVSDQGEEKHVLTVCTPLIASDGTAVGVIGCDMFLDFINDLLSDIHIFESGYMVLTDRNGTVFYSPDESDLMKSKQEVGLNYPSNASQGIFYTVSSAVDGRESLAYTTPVYFDLISGMYYLSVVAPFAEIGAEANHILMILIISAVCAAVLIPALIFMFVARMLRPMSNVTQALSEFSKGNLDARITGEYNDEFGPIKDAFNDMAASLKTYLNDKLSAERAAHESELAKGRAEAAREAVMSSIQYASKIQKNLLPTDAMMSKIFIDYSVIWKPRDVVGGDVYWAKRFGKRTVLCVADCTGHGTPGALLTMLVTSALDSMVTRKNCDDTADILWQIDQKLSSVLHVDSESAGKRSITDIDDGCDLAVLSISVDGSVAFSSGNIPVFVCDGEKVVHYRGQKLFAGEGRLRSKQEVESVTITPNLNNKFYIASDGLFDQIGGERGIQFGYDKFKSTILEHHHEKLSVITGKVWEEYEHYRGAEERRDDFELVAFVP